MPGTHHSHTTVPASVWARRWGFTEEAVVSRIRAGILDGRQDGEEWVVVDHAATRASGQAAVTERDGNMRRSREIPASYLSGITFPLTLKSRPRAKLFLLAVVAISTAVVVYFYNDPEGIGAFRHLSPFGLACALVAALLLPREFWRHQEVHETHITEKPSLDLGPLTGVVLGREKALGWDQVRRVGSRAIPYRGKDPKHGIVLSGKSGGKHEEIHIPPGCINYTEAITVIVSKVPAERVEASVREHVASLHRSG